MNNLEPIITINIYLNCNWSKIYALAAIFSVLRGEKFIHESPDDEFETPKGLVSEKVVSKEKGK